MKILLINPEWSIENRRNLWLKVRSSWPSMGLLSIASALQKEGHDVTYHERTDEFIIIKNEYDFIGMTATTNTINNAYQYAKTVKELHPNTKIVFGGVHPTILPEESLEKPYIDFVIRDEGEITFKELAGGKEPSEILGLSYKKDNKVIHNSDREPIENLDSLPMPAYDLLNLGRYHPAVGSYKRLPAMIIIATRNCPNKCTYCFHAKGKPRTKSAERILEEIKFLKQRGIREVSFYDDSFTLFKDNVKKLCNLIMEQKINISWSCFSRVDYVDKELLQLMKKAGCHLILFGIESGDEEMLKRIKKNITLQQARQAVEWCNQIGMNVRCSFMLGNQGETEESIKKTIEFALSLDITSAQFNIATPYPGTEFYNWADENNYLITKDWSRYTVSESLVKLPTISQERLLYYNKLTHRKFYMRPRLILKRLLRIHSWNQLKQEIQGAIAVLS